MGRATHGRVLLLSIEYWTPLIMHTHISRHTQVCIGYSVVGYSIGCSDAATKVRYQKHHFPHVVIFTGHGKNH